MARSPLARLLIGLLIGWGLIIGSGLLAAPAIASPISGFGPTLGAIPGLSNLLAGTPPDQLGVQDGHLAPCPEAPNCVVSQGNPDATHSIDPIPYTTDRAIAHDILIKVLEVVPRTTLVEQTPDYIRVASTSRLLGFVDDGEFYFPADDPVIHLRSAARLGQSDLGVNRRRLEQIRLALRDLGLEKSSTPRRQ